MNAAETFVPLSRVTFETAAEHSTRDGPAATMQTTAVVTGA
jgi:hypothetical protein